MAKLRNVLNNFDLHGLNRFEKIYVLVSGGFDSTYLYEFLRTYFTDRIIPVNCYNPYEFNETLKKISKNDDNMIFIQPDKYKDVIKKAFLNLPRARELKKNKKYSKKIFPCCYVLKHKNIEKDNRFKTEKSVIISGIKRRDSRNRFSFLIQMARGTFKTLKDGKPNFYLRHKNSKMLYCYPFRDYDKRELPDDIKDELWAKYPHLQHSGCSLCPVLVLFKLVKEGERYERSVQYAKNLGVM